MSYVTPPTFVSAATLAAADLNILSEDIADLDARARAGAFQGVALVRSAAQSISASADTAISFVTAPVDEGSWWTSGTDVVVPSGAIPPGSSQIAVEISAAARFAP